jgi:predicted  nucleic acid-binding Zn-ribbon protein
MTTDAEFEKRLNQRSSDRELTNIHTRINDLSADAGMMRKNLDALHHEMRDIRTQTTSTQKWVEDNSKITREIRDLLGSFAVISSFAKWITTVAAAITIAWAITKGWFVGK